MASGMRQLPGTSRFQVVQESHTSGLTPNGVDLRRAGDVNPLIFVANQSKSGDLRTPLAVGIP